MRIHATSAFLPLLAAVALIGCENADSEKGVSWNGSSRPELPAVEPAAPAANPSSGASSQASSSSSSSSSSSTSSSSSALTTATPLPAVNQSGAQGVGDAVDFGSLNWSFGGVSGRGASQSGVVISGLSCSKDRMSFRYNSDLRSWGYAHDYAGGAYACLFVQKSDGSWVGGKFDWISSSRTTRGFENINGHYNGWSLSGVPNPCNVAFVILNKDCRRRSNVITGRWSR